MKEQILQFMVGGQQYSASAIAKRTGHPTETVSELLEQMYATKEVSRVIAGGRSPRYIKRKAQPRTLTPAQLEAEILSVMGEGEWFQKDVADAVGRSRQIVRDAMLRLEYRGILKKRHHKHQFYFYFVAQKPETKWEPECEDADALRQLVSQQWRGSWLQGMECVL